MGVGLDSASEGSNSSMNSSMNSSARLGRAGRVKFGFRFWDLQPSSNKSGGSGEREREGVRFGFNNFCSAGCCVVLGVDRGVLSDD